MAMKTFSIILLLCFTLSSQAQNYFNHTFGEGDPSMNAGKIIETPDGFIILGFTVENNEKVFYAKKLNIEGEEVLTKNLLVGDVLGWERPHNGIATSDGNYVVSINERLESGNTEIVFFKINSDVDIIWTHRYGGPVELSHEVIGQISETSDNGFLITGASAFVNSDGNPISDSQLLIIKTNSDGEIEWMQLIDEPLFSQDDEINRSFICYSHLEMPNGNLLLACGSCEIENGSIISCADGTSINVLTTLAATTGEVLEEQVLDDYSYQIAPLIVPMDEEHFLLTQIGPVDDFMDFRNSWIVSKYNYEGEQIWEQYYPNDGVYFRSSRTSFNTLPIVREDGSFIGLFKHTDGFIGEDGLWVLGTASSLALFNPNGEWDSTITLGKDMTEAIESRMIDFERTNDGGYALAGYSYPKNQSYASKAWVVKMDSSFNQCTGSPCDSILVEAPPEIVDVGWSKMNNQAVHIYPNPSSGMFRLDLATILSTDLSYQVYDVSGHLVKEESIPENRTFVNLDLSAYQQGVYFLHLYEDGGLIGVERLIFF